LLRNGANILKIIIYEPFILNFSILGLIFHNLSKKCLNRFTDENHHQQAQPVGSYHGWLVLPAKKHLSKMLFVSERNWKWWQDQLDFHTKATEDDDEVEVMEE
jgi:hypothetical protein